MVGSRFDDSVVGLYRVREGEIVGPKPGRSKRIGRERLFVPIMFRKPERGRSGFVLVAGMRKHLDYGRRRSRPVKFTRRFRLSTGGAKADRQQNIPPLPGGAVGRQEDRIAGSSPF